MNAAIRENGVGYWLALIHNTASYYVRNRRPVAGLRALAATILRGDFGERCQVCGRAYPLWHADNALYASVAEHPTGGLLCPTHFDARARRLGLRLIWTPTIFTRVPEDQQ